MARKPVPPNRKRETCRLVSVIAVFCLGSFFFGLSLYILAIDMPRLNDEVSSAQNDLFVALAQTNSYLSLYGQSNLVITMYKAVSTLGDERTNMSWMDLEARRAKAASIMYHLQLVNESIPDDYYDTLVSLPLVPLLLKEQELVATSTNPQHLSQSSPVMRASINLQEKEKERNRYLWRAALYQILGYVLLQLTYVFEQYFSFKNKFGE